MEQDYKKEINNNEIIEYTYNRQKTGGLAGWQLKLINAMVRESIEPRLTIRDLAAAARLSASHFSRAFRKSYGMTPTAYVTKTRIEIAQCLLLDDTLPIREVALLCGFSDQPHFTRVFRDATGKPPRQWQRERLPR